MKIKNRYDDDAVEQFDFDLDSFTHAFEIEEDAVEPALNVAELITITAHASSPLEIAGFRAAITISPWRAGPENDRGAAEPGFRSLGFAYHAVDDDRFDLVVDLPAPLFQDLADRSRHGGLRKVSVRLDCIPDAGLAATVRGLTFN
jgi:hypothetical protein